jgi:Protein of unknown function (DUF3606)
MTQPRCSPERAYVNVHEDYELRYWSERFDVPKDEIQAAVKKSARGSRTSPANSAVTNTAKAVLGRAANAADHTTAVKHDVIVGVAGVGRYQQARSHKIGT